MSFGYFILAGATLGLKNASLFVFLSGLIHMDTCNDTSGQIVGKISSSSLRKAPFFFLLASDLGNFGRVAWQSQTKLEHKPAVRQVRLRQILACHGERNVHFLLRFNELSKSPLLSFWLANVATDLNGTPAGSLMTKPTHLNFCYLWNFLIWLYAVPLDIKTHPSPGNDSLPSQLTDAIYVALLLFILSQREWLNGFVVSPKKMWSYIVWNLQAQVIIFLEEIFTGSSLEIAWKVGRTLDKVVLLDLLTQSSLFTLIVIRCA